MDINNIFAECSFIGITEAQSKDPRVQQTKEFVKGKQKELIEFDKSLRDKDYADKIREEYVYMSWLGDSNPLENWKGTVVTELHEIGNFYRFDFYDLCVNPKKLDSGKSVEGITIELFNYLKPSFMSTAKTIDDINNAFKKHLTSKSKNIRFDSDEDILFLCGAIDEDLFKSLFGSLDDIVEEITDSIEIYIKKYGNESASSDLNTYISAVQKLYTIYISYCKDCMKTIRKSYKDALKFVISDIDKSK